MGEDKKNGLATVQEIKSAAARWASEQFEEPQDVKLPTLGITVRLRRPKPVYFAVVGLPLPQSIAATASGGLPAVKDRAELLRLADATTKLLTQAFVHPRVSLTPGEDEIDPNMLLPDYPFLVKYLVGEVLAGGQDLATFRDRAAGGPAAAGPDGNRDEVPPKRSAVRKSN